MKAFFKKIVIIILGSQVRRLRAKHNFKIIGVVGSIGKTSTKIAIAKILEQGMRVNYQEGNYNDIVSVPLVFFREEMPSPIDIFSWLKIFISNEIKINSKYPFDAVVLELGTDGPGQIAEFRKYLELDIAVLTAIAPEHMEFFASIQDVAEEEWSVSFWSKLVFANKDLSKNIPENIDHKKVIFYGKDFGSEYKIDNIVRGVKGFYFEIIHNGKRIFDATYDAVSEVQLYSVAAACIIGLKFFVAPDKMKETLENFESFPGRMQKLQGVKNSVIIDDTYNASPDAVKIALDTLYSYPASQRIAILGMMNELGVSSESEHKKIGKICNPKLLDFVVTIGEDANKYLAPAARAAQCTVYEAKSSKEAGFIVLDKLRDHAVILAKGSQNGVFAEEALKPLLLSSQDYGRLVRQSPEWLKKKGISR